MQVRVERLGDQVVRVLASRIINGEFEGERAPSEQEICSEFGVSKTVAREVSKALAGMGLVAVQHGRRMQLRPRDEWDHFDPLLLELQTDHQTLRRSLKDLTDLRLLLEPEIAARAALDATKEQRIELATLVAEMERSEDSPEEFLRRDAAFHLALARAGANELIAYVVLSIRGLLAVSLRLTTGLPTAHHSATLEHERILQAIERLDPDAARAAMEAHLLHNAEGLGFVRRLGGALELDPEPPAGQRATYFDSTARVAPGETAS